ncbi:MAG: BT4734/BF3469 family protein [Solidesulfovibrio sp.]|uniref:BT4734/BF3469 family protein n=1 Tax=Solidesulfovibrio sp. TaxID=2910990 RepID=UPI00315815F5
MEELQNVWDLEFSHGIGFYPMQKYQKMTLKELYKFVTDEKNEKNFELLRSDNNSVSPERKSEIKKKLPWVTLSGEFTGNRSGNKFTSEKVSLVQADFDHVNEPNILKRMLAELPCVAMTFISPSGNGVKAIIHVENGCNDFSRIWSSVSIFLNKRTGHQIDAATKDISRLMFLSYDPDCYKNESTIPLKITQQVNESNIVETQNKNVIVSEMSIKDDLINVASALRYIDCEDYQIWLQVGMALHNTFFASEEAKQLWADWSQQSAKFNQSTMDYKWNSFKNYSGNKISIATIFKIATANGWKGKKQVYKQILRLDDCNEREKTGVKTLVDEWLFCSCDNKIINRNTFEELHGVGRDSLVKSLCGSKSYSFAIQQMQRIYNTIHWWGYHGIVYYDNKKLFSKWAPYVPQNKENENYNQGDAIKILEKFLEINYDEPELLLKWIACCVHGGVKKPDFGLALFGDKGSGKSIIYDIICSLIGVQNAVMRTPLQADSKFNGDFEGKRLVFFDEMVAGKKELLDFQNDIKDKVTGKELKVRAMKKDQFVVPNHAMFMMATNDSHGLPIEENDGRWLVLKTKIEVQNRIPANVDEKKVVDSLWGIIEKFPGYLFEELKSIDFKNIPRSAPVTAYQKQVNEMKVSYTEEVVAEYINENLHSDVSFIKSSSFKDWCIANQRKVNNNELQKSFAKFNYLKTKNKIDGKEYRGYQKSSV